MAENSRGESLINVVRTLMVAVPSLVIRGTPAPSRCRPCVLDVDPMLG